MAHSLTQNWKNCFFFRKSGKKNTCFFFPGKVYRSLWVTHSTFQKYQYTFFLFFPFIQFFFFCKSDSLTKFQFLSQIDRFFHGHYQLSCLNIWIYMHNFLFKTHFEWFPKICTCFSFFSGISFFSCFFLFFFFLEKLKFTHSLVWKACFFFSGGGKKKNSFFTHSHDFWPKVRKNELFPEKKKTPPLL